MLLRSVRLFVFRALFGRGVRILRRLRRRGLPVCGRLFPRLCGLFCRLCGVRFGRCLFGGLFLRLFGCLLCGVQLCGTLCKRALCRFAHFAQDELCHGVRAPAQEDARKPARHIRHEQPAPLFGCEYLARRFGLCIQRQHAVFLLVHLEELIRHIVGLLFREQLLVLVQAPVQLIDALVQLFQLFQLVNHLFSPLRAFSPARGIRRARRSCRTPRPRPPSSAPRASGRAGT